MNIAEISPITNWQHRHTALMILRECGEYAQTPAYHWYKNLSADGPPIRKIKVRKRGKGSIPHHLREFASVDTVELLRRSVVVTPHRTPPPPDQNTFVIIPANGHHAWLSTRATPDTPSADAVYKIAAALGSETGRSILVDLCSGSTLNTLKLDECRGYDVEVALSGMAHIYAIEHSLFQTLFPRKYT